MAKSRSTLDYLRATSPVMVDQVDRSDSKRADDLLARILATPREAEPSVAKQQRSRRRVLAYVLAGLATVAAALYFTRPIEVPNAVLCYEAPNLDADIAAAPAGGPATADACQLPWSDGDLSNPEVVQPGQVPPLTGCVNADGALAVFPTADSGICESLGLARPDDASQADADAIRQLDLDLIGYFLSSACIPMDEATDHVRAELDQAGLGDWSVQTTPPTSDRPCASFSLDATSETIFLVPVPGPDTTGG